ncbi:hypothetical protein B0H16DRAFT_1339218, partial [Mycena metata]
QITWILNQNFGVAVLSNDEAFGNQIMEAIKFRILDEVLNLQSSKILTLYTTHFDRFKSLIVAGFKGPTPRPTNPTLPSFSFNGLAGTYHDPGYGSLHLCLVGPGDPTKISSKARFPPPPARFSSTCTHVLSELEWIYRGVTHVALTHFEHDIFNVTGLILIPTGNTSDSKPWVQVEVHPGFVGEFAVEGKLRVGFRGIWGPGAGVQSPKGESVKERAEVWFEKLG